MFQNLVTKLVSYISGALCIQGKVYRLEASFWSKLASPVTLRVHCMNWLFCIRFTFSASNWNSNSLWAIFIYFDICRWWRFFVTILNINYFNLTFDSTHLFVHIRSFACFERRLATDSTFYTIIGTVPETLLLNWIELSCILAVTLTFVSPLNGKACSFWYL